MHAPSATDPVDVLSHLLAVQSQEHPYARWSLAQRTKRPDASAVDRAFDDGRILRTHVLRPTWHYVAREDLRWLMTLSGPRVRAVIARRTAELGLDPRSLARAHSLIADALSEGFLTRKQIGELLARKRIDPAGQRLPHILMHAELAAIICSGPMSGKDHTYALFDERVPQAPALERDEALQRLAARYFAARGPATLKDFTWWSGLSVADARRAIDLAPEGLDERATEDGRTYWFAGPVSSGTPGAPAVDLIQCYDELIISYTQSRDVLHGERASFRVPDWHDGFTHVILLDAQLLGVWRLRKGVIETRISPELSSAEQSVLDAAMQACERFYGVARGPN